MIKNRRNMVGHRRESADYWKFPEEGFPKTIWWKVVVGNRQLTMMEDHDIVFDNYDLKIRKIDK